jgi:hypothetical protein
MTIQANGVYNVLLSTGEITTNPTTIFLQVNSAAITFFKAGFTSNTRLPLTYTGYFTAGTTIYGSILGGGGSILDVLSTTFPSEFVIRRLW